MNCKFKKLFLVNKPIIGMIHLAGDGLNEKTIRALSELELYQEEGIDGAIIEDYHATGVDLVTVLGEISKREWRIKLGVNWLNNPYGVFELANNYGASFVQLDSVQGTKDRYISQRKEFSDLVVLGGVGFKYQPDSGKTLREDIEEGKPRCDAVVTTGEGTGIETPIKKLKKFRVLLRDYPLISGAGVNLSNIYEQLQIADSVIIGSYFKPEKNTHLSVDRIKVHDFMSVVRKLR